MALRGFVLKRIAFMTAMIFIMLTITFFALRILPGDPARLIAGPTADTETIERIRHQFGLDHPLPIQYAQYLINLLQGNFGSSYVTSRDIRMEIQSALPTSIELAIGGMAFAILVGVLLGLYSAKKQNTIADHLGRVYTTLGISMPVFWLGILLQMLIGVYLGILPVSGRHDAYVQYTPITGFTVLDSILTLNPLALADALAHLALPTLTLGIYISAYIVRLTRANVIDALNKEHIFVARLRGLSESEIIYKHAFRNALPPVVTYVAMNFAALLGGSVAIELIFSLPGLGRLLLESLYLRDYPIIQAAIVLYSLLIAIASMLADISYYLIDPRVRY